MGCGLTIFPGAISVAAAPNDGAVGGGVRRKKRQKVSVGRQ